ncbi:hypothetical protein JL722_1064 [Aureococcus anophagefferens]|nr:hypothetical protein JL722_1064 [Aureococcus anophagefferens]
MCGILGIFDVPPNTSQSELRKKLIECVRTRRPAARPRRSPDASDPQARRLRHRGPDWSGYQLLSRAPEGAGLKKSGSGTLLGIGANSSSELTISEGGARGKAQHAIAHERLAIMDPESGAQPLFAAAQRGPDGTVTVEEASVIVAANGEIYNYKELYAELAADGFAYAPKTGSDCEVLIRATQERFNVASTLYIGRGPDGTVWIASELKAMARDCPSLEQFKPGHCWRSDTKDFVEWYAPAWRALLEGLPAAPCDYAKLREAFEKAVERRMMSDVPWGVLLSGGLDSSLVASVAQRFLKKKEGLDAVAEVVHHLETYDVTTIRAATPMFLMARKIKAMGVKMVLSGEGADEILAGYLYFHKAPDGAAKEGEIPNFKGSDLGHFPLAPDAGELFAELKDKVKQLYIYDCLRANKSTMAWGVEARVPFLDADFLDVAMSIDPREKMIDVKAGRIEKYILRKAFDVPEDPYLPKEILWRQKAFSDGVGSAGSALRDHAEAHVSDHQFSVAPHRFAYNTPRTKEAYYYRQIFDSLYPSLGAAQTIPEGKSIACSTERALKWDASFEGRADQSGRSVGVHVAAYDASFDADADTKKAAGRRRRRAFATRTPRPRNPHHCPRGANHAPPPSGGLFKRAAVTGAASAARTASNGIIHRSPNSQILNLHSPLGGAGARPRSSGGTMVSFSKEAVIASSAVAVGVALLARKVRALSDAKHATTAFAEREDCHLTLPGPHPLFPEFEVNGQGLRIFTRAWTPAAAPRATVLLVHGFAEHSGRYGALGAALAAAGYAVVALDHQGHGRSEGCRGHVERFAHYVDDVCIHAAASGRIAKLRGVALSAPAVEPDPEMATPLLVFLARKLSNALPKLQLDPLPSKYLSRDATVIEQYLNDPLVYTGGVRARFGAEMLDAMAACFDLAKRECRGVPLLLLHGTGDRVIDPGGSTRLCDAWAGPTQLELLPGEFHEIFNEPGRERAYGLLVDWLGATLLA